MASTKTLRRTEIGPPSSVCALMVQITWTSARVVKMTAQRDFILKCVSADTRSGTILDGVVPVKIFAGTVLYFAASDSQDGYYYLTRIIGESVSCSCPAKSCKHQGRVMDFTKGIFYKAEKAKKPAPAVQPAAATVQPSYPPIKRRDEAFWKENAKQDRERQKREKAEYLAKLASVRAADRASAGVA